MNPFNADGTFVSPFENGAGELRRLTVRGASATLAAGVMTLSTQIIATMILARILTPADFGLVTMVTTFSLLVANFGFNGLTEAIVQCDAIDHALASTLFWINAACGILLTIAFAEAGSLLARFFHDPLVQRVTVVVSLTIFATSISTVHLALLKRAMHFSWVSVNDICARAGSVALSIFLGWMGWGYWALVAGAVALPVSTSVGGFILCRWIPGFPRKVAGTGSMLRFALNTYGNFGVNYLSRNTDNLLVGWRFDAQSLGFYKKAYDLFALSANQLVASIAVVVVAALSRVRRDPALYRRYLLDSLAVMVFVGMGLGAGLTIVGKDLIFVLLGPKWGPAGRIFSYFGPGIGIMILYGTHGWIHLSLGRADRWFRWAIIEFIVTVTLFIGCLQWGPVGIATAWSASFWILTFPAIWYAGRPIGLASRSGSLHGLEIRGRIPYCRFSDPLRSASDPRSVRDYRLGGSCTSHCHRFNLHSLVYLSSVVLLHGGFAPLLQIAGLFGEMIQSRKPTPEDVPFQR